MNFEICTEFFLALIYFSIIFIVNFFLYKLLRNYFKNIWTLRKIKKIREFYPNNEFFLKLYNYKVIDSNNYNNLLNLQKNNYLIFDTLIIGNIFKYLLNKNSTNNKNISTSDYYLQLLTNQYISFVFNLK